MGRAARLLAFLAHFIFYNTVGEVIVLPIGSTVLDFAFKVSDKIGIGWRERKKNPHSVTSLLWKHEDFT